MRTLVVVVSVLGLAACKTDKTDKAKPPAAGSAAAKTATGSGSDAGSGSASSSTPKTAGKATNITLPKGDGSPPKKTEKQLTKAQFEELAKLEFPGFTKVVRNSANVFDVRHTTPRPTLATTVTIAPCFDCTPMDLEKWQAKGNTMKALLAEELRDRPDTVWDLGKTEINGQTMIYTYQLGQVSEKDDLGNPQSAFTNAYALYFNDGKNQIRVVAEYKDDMLAREDLTAIAPREDLEKLARAFMDIYTQKW